MLHGGRARLPPTSPRTTFVNGSSSAVNLVFAWVCCLYLNAYRVEWMQILQESYASWTTTYDVFVLSLQKRQHDNTTPKNPKSGLRCKCEYTYLFTDTVQKNTLCIVIICILSNGKFPTHIACRNTWALAHKVSEKTAPIQSVSIHGFDRWLMSFLSLHKHMLGLEVKMKQKKSVQKMSVIRNCDNKFTTKCVYYVLTSVLYDSLSFLARITYLNHKFSVAPCN